MALSAAQAKYDDLHKDLPFHDGTFTTWSSERTPQTPFEYREGVTVWVASMDLTPDDTFLDSRPADQSPNDDAEGPQCDD